MRLLLSIQVVKEILVRLVAASVDIHIVNTLRVEATLVDCLQAANTGNGTDDMGTFIRSIRPKTPLRVSKKCETRSTSIRTLIPYFGS